LEEAVQVLLEKRRVAVADAKAFPHSVTKNETCIEDAHHGFGSWDEPTVDRDQYLRVARVILVVVCSMRRRHCAIIAALRRQRVISP
jgi:hypothetical protein